MAVQWLLAAQAGLGLLSSLQGSKMEQEGLELQKKQTIQAANFNNAAEAQSAAFNKATLQQSAAFNLGMERASANFNRSLIDVQTARQQGTLARDTRRLISSQRAAAARSGLDVTSKSFLTIMSDTLENTEREMLQIRNNALIQKSAIEFGEEAKVAAIDLQTNQQIAALDLRIQQSRAARRVETAQSVSAIEAKQSGAQQSTFFNLLGTGIQAAGLLRTAGG